MGIAPITAGDTNARAKLNEAIAKANLVDSLAANKAETSALAVEAATRQADVAGLELRKATREAAADARIGPGEYPTFWSSEVDTAVSPAALSPDLAATDSDGRVIRVSTAAKLGPIALTRIEPGRKYKARFAFRRRTNSPDPANDGVRLAVRWFGQSKAPVADPAGTTIIQDITTLTTGSGRQAVTVVFAREAGAGVDFVAPAGARYGRPFLQMFGLGSVTDIEVIDCVDITDATLWSPEVGDLDSRLAAVESVDAGSRLDYLEAVANDPEAMTLASIGALEAANLPAGVQSVTLLSGAADGDGLGGIYRRAGGVTPIQSLDGAYWEEVNPLVKEPDQPTAVAGLDARLPMTARRVKDSVDANAFGADWSQRQAGAPVRTFGKKVRERISAFDDMTDSLIEAVENSEVTSVDHVEISAAINNMIEDAVARGKMLHLDPGLYWAQDIVLRDRLHLRGVMDATILKLPNGSGRPIFNDPNIGASTSLKYLGFEGLTIDGNAANFDRTVAAKSNISLAGFEKLFIRDVISKNATGYGGAAQARPGTAYDGPQAFLYMENVGFENNGFGTDFNSDTFDGFDAKKLDFATLIGVWALNNGDTGIDLRARDATHISCRAKGNRNFGFAGRIEAGDGRLSYIACLAEGNSGSLEGYGHGFYCRSINGGDVNPLSIEYQRCIARGNALDGFNFGVLAQTLTVGVLRSIAEQNGRHGYNVESSTTLSAAIIDSIGRGNGASGLKNNGISQSVHGGEFSGNGNFGIEEGTAANRNKYTGRIKLRNNVSGNWLFNTVNRYVSPDVDDFVINAAGGDILASAPTLVLPEGGEVFDVTGSSNIMAFRSAPLVASPGVPGPLRRNRRFALRGAAGSTATVSNATGEIYLSAGLSPVALGSRDVLSLMSSGTEVHAAGYSNN